MLAKFVVHKLRDHAGVLNILNIQCDHLSAAQAPNRTSNYQSPSQTESVNHSQPGCQEKSNWWNRVDESSSSFWEKGSAPPEQGSSGWGENSSQKSRGGSVVLRECLWGWWPQGLGSGLSRCWHRPGAEKQRTQRLSAEFLLEYDPSEWFGMEGSSNTI